MAYILINEDNTINFVGEHPIDSSLDFSDTKLVEFKSKSKDQLLNGISVVEGYWDGNKIIRDPVLEGPGINKGINGT